MILNNFCLARSKIAQYLSPFSFLLLEDGDLGAVVHCYEDGDAFEVEFIDFDGKTIALLTLNREDIRQLGGRKVFHVRELLPIAV